MNELELKTVCDEILILADIVNGTLAEVQERNSDNEALEGLTDGEAPKIEPGNQFEIRCRREHGKAWVARVTRESNGRGGTGRVVTVARSAPSNDPTSALLALRDAIKDDLRRRRDAMAPHL